MIAGTPRKTRTKPHSTNILDYHSNLSTYEKDSLASEAKLKVEGEKKKTAKIRQALARAQW